MAMRNYRDLKFIGSLSEQDKLFQLIEEKLHDGWIRDKNKESDFKDKNSEYKIFIRSKVDHLPSCALFLTPDNNSFFYVCNIAPEEELESPVENYNTVLEEFFVKFVQPSVDNLDIRVIFSEADKTIDNSMSPELADKLKRFSGAANKASAGTHPLDQERFLDFIIQAHLESSLLDESTLDELLKDENWSSKDALELSIKYNFGRKMLKRFAL